MIRTMYWWYAEGKDTCGPMAYEQCEEELLSWPCPGDILHNLPVADGNPVRVMAMNSKLQGEDIVTDVYIQEVIPDANPDPD